MTATLIALLIVAVLLTAIVLFNAPNGPRFWVRQATRPEDVRLWTINAIRAGKTFDEIWTARDRPDDIVPILETWKAFIEMHDNVMMKRVCGWCGKTGQPSHVHGLTAESTGKWYCSQVCYSSQH